MKFVAYLLILLGILIILAACGSYGFLLYIASSHGVPMSGLGIMLNGRPLGGTGFTIIHLILVALGAFLVFFGWRKRKAHA